MGKQRARNFILIDKRETRFPLKKYIAKKTETGRQLPADFRFLKWSESAIRGVGAFQKKNVLQRRFRSSTFGIFFRLFANPRWYGTGIVSKNVISLTLSSTEFWVLRYTEEWPIHQIVLGGS